MKEEGLNDWRLVLVVNVTKREEEKQLDELVKDLGGTSTEIIKNPDSTTLWQTYAKSKIYWHAAGFGEDLVSHPDRAEHFGIATVEAMGMGAVPIVINAGGQKEIVDDGKTGFLWDTYEELIAKTSNVIVDQELRTRLAEAAKERAKDFTMDTFCHKITALLQ
jgi:glycosyltransferase involved in cell wall biosynthesis